MRIILCFILYTFLSSSSIAGEKSHISFQRINSRHVVKIPLPLKCRIYTGKNKAQFGTILSVTDNDVQFEAKEYDTAEVSAILAIDTLSRKQKYDLVDSLISRSNRINDVPFDSITKISILSGHDKKTRELLVLASALGFMGSTVVFMISVSNHVGSEFTKWNWIELIGIGSSAGIMTLLIKRNFDMSKWKISANS